MCVKLSSYTYLVHTGYSHIVVEVNVSWNTAIKKKKKYLNAIVFSFFTKSLFRLRVQLEAALKTCIFRYVFVISMKQK